MNTAKTIATLTGAIVPTDIGDTSTLKPGLYLSLYHGRQTPAEELSDWGAPGPVIGPLRNVHTTYCAEVRVEFETVEDHDNYFPREAAAWDMQHRIVEYRREAELVFIEDLLAYNGMYYGDWTVFVVPGARESEAEKLLAALRADIEAMQHGREYGDPIHEMHDTEIDPDNFFGPFARYYDHGQGVEGIEQGFVEAPNGVSIEWPNLRILLERK